VDDVGRAFVAHTMQGIVKVFDANTGLLLGNIGEFGGGTGQLNMPIGLMMDGFNRLCVVSANNTRVELFGVDSYLNPSVPAPGGNLAAGNNLIFNVTSNVTSGVTGQTFQWQRNGVNIAGATNGALTIGNANTGDSGNYSVVICSASGSITSSITPVAVLHSPNIAGGPQSQTVLCDAAVNFSVVATGSDLRFQWQFNGQNLANATAASLFLNDVQAAQSGQYSVHVSNAVGAVVSLPVALTVITPPLVMDVVSGTPIPHAGFQLTLNVDPGYKYDLQATTDFIEWQSIGEFKADGLLDFTDAGATNYLTRFYRLRWAP
jgi:hypothetical protein